MNLFGPNQRTRDQKMMTLCAISYTPFSSMAGLQVYLNKADMPEQTYTAIWWAKSSAAAVYVVKNKAADECIVVIRAALFKFGLSLMLSQYEDLDIAHQVSLPYSRLGQAKVAAGVLDTVLDINDLTYEGKTLQKVLNDLPRRTKIYITGHSVGGALATVYAAKLACSNLVELDVTTYTFGAPAIGNDAFAELFDPSKPNFLFTESVRCVNARDIIPHAWNDLQGMTKMDYGKVKCSVEFSLLLDSIQRLLILSKVFYVQPPLQMTLRNEREHYDTYFREAMQEHQPNTYLSLLGLDPINGSEFSYNDRKEVMLINSL